MSTEFRTRAKILVPGWLEAKYRELRADPESIRGFRNALLKRAECWEQAYQRLDPKFVERFQSLHWDLGPTLVSKCESTVDGATKLLFRTDKGHHFETVVMQMKSGRSAVCVSCQVGCAVRCAFCATGQSPVVQGLGVQEILYQVLFAKRLLKERGKMLRNVVFMGMGEPLLNLDAVLQSLGALASPEHFDLSFRHLLVSTVGIPDKMVRLATAMPKLGLALSLHSAQQEARNRLIPLGQRYDLAVLKAAILRCNRVQERPIMLEYLLLAGENDSPSAVDALLAFCRGLQLRVNIIPYNPVSGLRFQETSLERQNAIVARLKREGLAVTVRRSLGSDIAAACGQLVHQRKTAPLVGLGQRPRA